MRTTFVGWVVYVWFLCNFAHLKLLAPSVYPVLFGGDTFSFLLCHNVCMHLIG